MSGAVRAANRRSADDQQNGIAPEFLDDIASKPDRGIFGLPARQIDQHFFNLTRLPGPTDTADEIGLVLADRERGRLPVGGLRRYCEYGQAANTDKPRMPASRKRFGIAVAGAWARKAEAGPRC